MRNTVTLKELGSTELFRTIGYDDEDLFQVVSCHRHIKDPQRNKIYVYNITKGAMCYRDKNTFVQRVHWGERCSLTSTAHGGWQSRSKGEIETIRQYTAHRGREVGKQIRTGKVLVKHCMEGQEYAYMIPQGINVKVGDLIVTQYRGRFNLSVAVGEYHGGDKLESYIVDVVNTERYEVATHFKEEKEKVKEETLQLKFKMIERMKKFATKDGLELMIQIAKDYDPELEKMEREYKSSKELLKDVYGEDI